MATHLALYGGSFDPIHNGHLIVARAVAERLDLERVIFLPSARPPHKEGQPLTDPAQRARMIQAAIEGEPRFSFSDFDLTRDGPTYTFDTVTHFRNRFGPDTTVCWIIGADSLAELASWHRVGELVDRCRIITAVRAGWEQPDWDGLRTVLTEAQIKRLGEGVLETPAIEISSTDIRRRVRAGKSIRFLVPDAVRTSIHARWLYRKSGA